MNKKIPYRLMICGAAAGAINGLFGAGGGMVLVPLLSRLGRMEDPQLFPSSVGIILPVCLVSLSFAAASAPLPWLEALPYLLGSIIGGIFAGALGKRIPTLWLHRILGLLILWGGFRYLC